MALMIQVKICGVTRLEDALEAARLGASAVGFVFWPRSPRFIDPYRARDIVRRLPAFVTPIGVFVNQPLEHVESVAGLVRLGAIQLHGDETPEYFLALHRPIIKAVGVGKTFDKGVVDAWPTSVAVLVDADDREQRGGTGRPADWSLASIVARERRTILSGGLRAETVREAVETVRPYGVDASSGVEAAPGVKDHALMRRFFEALEFVPEGAS
jgi:phosphoribosylanthranilate isomerase